MSQQPDGLLVTKNEEDADLVEQLRVPLLDLKSISCFVCHENSTTKQKPEPHHPLRRPQALEDELGALPEEEDAAVGEDLPGASGEGLEDEDFMDDSAIQSALELASVVICILLK